MNISDYTAARSCISVPYTFEAAPEIDVTLLVVLFFVGIVCGGLLVVCGYCWWLGVGRTLCCRDCCAHDFKVSLLGLQIPVYTTIRACTGGYTTIARCTPGVLLP